MTERLRQCSPGVFRHRQFPSHSIRRSLLQEILHLLQVAPVAGVVGNGTSLMFEPVVHKVLRLSPEPSRAQTAGQRLVLNVDPGDRLQYQILAHSFVVIAMVGFLMESYLVSITKAILTRQAAVAPLLSCIVEVRAWLFPVRALVKPEKLRLSLDVPLVIFQIFEGVSFVVFLVFENRFATIREIASRE